MQTMPPVQESNGHARLARSSLKAEAIRRGDLKISGPLPIVEDEDNILNSDPPAAPSTPPKFDHHPLKFTDSLGSHPVERQPSPKQNSVSGVPTTQDNASVNLHPISDIHRHTMPVMSSTDHYSSTPTRSATQSPSDFPSKKKRKSGLMSVFKRMFSKREKRDVKKGPIQQPKHAYTRSDPGALSSSPKINSEPIPAPAPVAAPVVAEKPRVVEPSKDHVRPVTPLRPHLPFPMNVNAPQETSPPADRVNFDEQPAIRRRRATLPSVVFNSEEVSALAAIWSQSGTKVTAAEEQALITPLADSEIGIALSSPTQARSHRRSQSAGALRDLARTHAEHIPLPTSPRRRSAEIRFWRQSIENPASSIYSDKPDLIQDEGGALPVEKEAAAAETPITNPPMQDFNFGVLDTTGPTTAPITRSERKDARSQTSKSSLSNTSAHSEPTRQYSANTSRSQSILLEEAPRGKRSSRQRSASTVRENFSRPSSVRSASAAAHAAQSHAPKHPPPPPPQPAALSTPSTPQASFISTASTAPTTDLDPLITPIPSTETPKQQSPAPPSPSSSPTTHIHSLYTLLAHERAARKILEQHVHSLSRDLAHLRSRAAAYPTPSPDQIYTEHLRSSPPRPCADIDDEEPFGTMRHGPGEHGMTIGCGTGDDTRPYYGELIYDEFARDRRRETAISRFSKFEDSEDETDAERSVRLSGQSRATDASPSDVLVMKTLREEKSGSVEKMGVNGSANGVTEHSSRSMTDFGSPEVWETPREEFGAFGFAGEDVEEEDRRRMNVHSPPLRAAPAVPVGMF